MGLALVTGVKMVGLFTVATIGVATIRDLWTILDIKRGYSMVIYNFTQKSFWKHFGARALCLIVIPVLLYLVPFYIHFEVLYKSGKGDAFMSPAFQEHLEGNFLTANSTCIF